MQSYTERYTAVRTGTVVPEEEPAMKSQGVTLAKCLQQSFSSLGLRSYLMYRTLLCILIIEMVAFERHKTFLIICDSNIDVHDVQYM
jgi:hypothetical protein